MMKIKINQSNIKLAMLSTLLIGSAGFSVNGYAATTSDNMIVSTEVTLWTSELLSVVLVSRK